MMTFCHYKKRPKNSVKEDVEKPTKKDMFFRTKLLKKRSHESAGRRAIINPAMIKILLTKKAHKDGD